MKKKETNEQQEKIKALEKELLYLRAEHAYLTRLNALLAEKEKTTKTKSKKYK